MNFKDLKDHNDVANFFNISLRHLNYMLYVMPPNKAYKEFIVKTKKKERKIHSPNKRLKCIQNKLKDEFEKIYRPRISTFGFIKNRNTIKNAERHLDKRYIFNLDLQDYFPSISRKRIYYLLRKDPFLFNDEVAKIFSKLICFGDQLPQGSPCSPIISNMISYRMDGQLTKLAKKYNATYTRYVDDISFSFTNRFKALPKAIITHNEGELSTGNELNQIIESNGFTINQGKVRLGKKSNRMEVTGITVNEKLNVPRRYIKKIRTLFHLIDHYNYERANEIFSTFKRTRASKHPPKIEFALHGMLTYLCSVIGKDDPLYYKYALRFNNYDFKLKLPFEKPIKLRMNDSLWVVECLDDSNEEVNCYQGTAFSITSELIATAAHVVLDDHGKPFSEIEVYKTTDADNKFALQVISFNIEADTALCKIKEQYKDDSFISISNEDNLSSNISLQLLGFPSYQRPQYSAHTSTCHLTFETHRDSKRFFSINSPIIGGNSGGPIIDSQHRVVGIASKGYHGYGEIKSESLFSTKSIHVTISGNNLCSHISNLKDLLEAKNEPHN